MSIIRAFIQTYRVPSYYILVFVISFGGCLVVIGPSGILGTTPISAAQLPFVYLAALAGPGLAGILLPGLVQGKVGLRDLRSRLFRWRVGVRWYAVVLLTAPLLMTTILFALSLTSPVYLPAIVVTDDKSRLLLIVIGTGLAVPFLEELGWTGFAVPELRKRYGVLITGLIAGLLWGAWHFPLFSGAASSAEAIPPVLYLAVLLFSWLPPYRVLMVWVYDRTESLLMAMLMHVPIVVGVFVLVPQTMPAMAVVTFDLVFGTTLWIVVAAVAVANRGQLSRQRFPSTG
jgi:membrane protease YdiL (CAAX protease family)